MHIARGGVKGEQALVGLRDFHNWLFYMHIACCEQVSKVNKL